jgi:glycosyltransferase involved in cell wall biosynthesis
MLAVCIPVYNQKVERLVSDLIVQSQSFQEEVSIVIIDDASSEEFQDQYKNLRGSATIIQLDINIGRSKIRNAFLKHTSAEYLLFLDCDAEIIRSDFLSKYVDFIRSNRPKLLFGASMYQKETPRIYYRLRWRYGSIKESKSFEDRVNNEIFTLKTNNFLVDRKILATYPFNELIQGYGHEDTLFGFELEQNGILINHIDNPVLNAHLDSNTQFLNKTEEGLKNLLHVWQLVEENERLLERLKVLKTYLRYEHNLFLGITLRVFRRPLRFLLEIGFANLTLFNIYKLAYLFMLRSAQPSK